MNAVKQFFFAFLFDRRRSNIILAAIVLLAAAVLCYLVNADPATLRHLYCTANEAQAIECTQKGWW